MIIRKFYEKLGDFLYALSKSDGILYEKEEAVIMEEILSILKEHPGFENHPEIKDLLLTKLCFYNSGKTNKSVKNCVSDFFDFLEKNRTHISPLSQSLALRLIRKTGSAVKGVNKQENRLISQAEALLLDNSSIKQSD